MKTYQQILIAECGEPLVPISPEHFSLVLPHPYEQLGAPYGKKSPFYLRQGVYDRLLVAQSVLQQSQPGWQLQIFDAYRPIAVQQFMVDYTLRQVVRMRGWDLEQLTPVQQEAALEQVYEFWAVPNPDPAMPPPHSTGAAIDVTLLDSFGAAVDMGGAIDEISPRSYPNHFASSLNPEEQSYHQNRQTLNHAMTAAGFTRHPNEWWHFSFGDQMWAWLQTQANPTISAIAHYGAA